MMVCDYCGKEAPDPPITSCCGEVHFTEREFCPECGSDDWYNLHRDGDGLAPECDYKVCQECGNQWGHE